LAKGIQDERYRALITAMIDARNRMGLSQATFASRLRKRQQFISKYETGERRLDVVEFIDVAVALGLDPFETLRRLVKPSQPDANMKK